jgi:hypothetical protein
MAPGIGLGRGPNLIRSANLMRGADPNMQSTPTTPSRHPTNLLPRP